MIPKQIKLIVRFGSLDILSAISSNSRSPNNLKAILICLGLKNNPNAKMRIASVHVSKISVFRSIVLPIPQAVI